MCVYFWGGRGGGGIGVFMESLLLYEAKSAVAQKAVHPAVLLPSPLPPTASFLGYPAKSEEPSTEAGSNDDASKPPYRSFRAKLSRSFREVSAEVPRRWSPARTAADRSPSLPLLLLRSAHVMPP